MKLIVIIALPAVRTGEPGRDCHRSPRFDPSRSVPA